MKTRNQKMYFWSQRTLVSSILILMHSRNNHVPSFYVTREQVLLNYNLKISMVHRKKCL